jgi:hypothetical protein
MVEIEQKIDDKAPFLSIAVVSSPVLSQMGKEVVP